MIVERLQWIIGSIENVSSLLSNDESVDIPNGGIVSVHPSFFEVSPKLVELGLKTSTVEVRFNIWNPLTYDLINGDDCE